MITTDLREFSKLIAENQKKVRGNAAASCIKAFKPEDVATVLLHHIDGFIDSQFDDEDDDLYQDLSIRMPLIGASVNIGRDLSTSKDLGILAKVGGWAIDQAFQFGALKLIRPRPYIFKGDTVLKRIKKEVKEGVFVHKNKIVKVYKEDKNGEFKTPAKVRARKYCRRLNDTHQKYVDVADWNKLNRLLISVPLNTSDNRISGAVTIGQIKPFQAFKHDNGWDIIRKAHEEAKKLSDNTRWIDAINKQMSVSYNINLDLLKIYNKIDINKLINLKNKNLNFKQLRSIRISYVNSLEEANKIGDDVFQTGIFSDGRGRLYQATKHVNYGSHKLAKSLFMIAEKTKFNYRVNLVNASNLWGNDKVSVKEREAFALEHMPLWQAWAQDPYSHIEEIAKADDPFGFLGAIVEINRYLESDDKDNFTSGLIIAGDATNSGSQFLSLLSRDHVVGEIVNLTASTVRGDLYRYIADNCDLFETHQFWHKHKELKRKICKRSVMTYPYKCQSRKMGFSIYDDFKNDDGFESLTVEYCLELAQQIFDTCVEKLPGVTSLMNRFVDYSLSFSEKGDQLKVVFPDGLILKHNYYKYGTKQVGLYLNGNWEKIRVLDLDNKKPIKSKAETAPSANITHGFDSYFLRASILNCDFPMAVVHDSFGCTSGNYDAMSRILRETAVEIFEKDQLKEVLGITDVKFGKLKVEDVLENEYFIS